MKTITSVSGGKTSCYMALHYPTDQYIFAVVLVEHEPSAPKDKGLLRECQQRIPHFVASHEADQTLLNILRLEQELGKEIWWVSAEYSLDRFALGQTDHPGYRTGHHLLPNRRTRFCTVEQKLKPIFWHCYLHGDGEPVLMNVGFRWDEPKRVEEWTCKNDKLRIPVKCPVNGGNWSYQDFEWRVTRFPLYEDRISNPEIRQYWDRKGWEFPEVSNCRFCFFHTDYQLQLQAEREQGNLQWWVEMEKSTGNTFGDRPIEQILQQPLLPLFDDPPQFSCMCSD